MQIQIYGLTDPDTSAVHYVGRTKQKLFIRLNQHIQEAKRIRNGSSKHKHPRAAWIRSLIAAGKRPKITLLETTTEDLQVSRESFWMQSSGLLVNSGSAAQGGTRSYIAHWTPELDARLGVEADSVIAKDLGVTRKAVTYRRSVLGIPASFNRARNVPPPPMGGWNRIELPSHILEQLGTVSDAKLGAIAGVSKRTIMEARRLRAVPAFGTVTGNLTRFKKGDPHPRWSRQRG